ncbi:MAG TPA: asparagine synthase-related protein [Solirubrobacteraceae bacterium]|nr:asparagine synthase-related protein [Solirubrobacteraceae bacterium]
MDLRLRPFDVACGWPFDDELPSARPLEPHGDESPAEALEAVVLEALRRPPCVVSFSGGRDSSLVLAAAVSAARRHGLPSPVPVSFVFPHAPDTVETEWQERVIAHLGLDDWQRVNRPEELDYLGPAARQVLRRHGLSFPANAFWQVLVVEHARDGALLTGTGGDELLGRWRWQRAADVLARRARPRPRDALRIGLAAAPAAVRRRVREGEGTELPWLRPAAQERLRRATARQRAAEPASWRRRVAWLTRLRYVALQQRTLAAIAADVGATAEHPFFHPRFVAAVGAAGGRLGLGPRGEAMQALFGELLPPDVLARPTKAIFNAVWQGPRTREFVEAWDGRGVDAELVDVERLAELWRGPHTDARSALLLHRAWLESAAGGVDECSTPKG